MEEDERYHRRKTVRHQALRRLGVTNVRCICGEGDPVCFEADHIYRREMGETCWGLCKNCHAKRSARGWSEHPPIRPGPVHPLQPFAHLLLGVCDYLSFIVDHLSRLAELLFKLVEAGVTVPE